MNVDQWWESIALEDMSSEQWESICDGCANCCRIQLEDEEGQRATTSAVCEYLDIHHCHCNCYSERSKKVPTCIKLTPDQVHLIDWMPASCSYRLLKEGKPLHSWHPLMSGNSASVHEANISVRGKVISERLVNEGELQELIVQWH